MDSDERIREVLKATIVVRPPRRALSTFGTTNVSYYLVTALTDIINVVREGSVLAEKPRIVTPGYLMNLEGFNEPARRFIQMMAEQAPHEPAVFYRYKNEARKMDVVSEPVQQILDNISSIVEGRGDPLVAIIRGVEEMWDVSLIKFTYELTRKSLGENIADLQAHGLLETDRAGLPGEARRHIEELFARAREDRSRISELGRELHRWGVFNEYQDRFFALLNKRQI